MFIQSNPKETGFMQYFFSFGLLENKVKVMKKWNFFNKTAPAVLLIFCTRHNLTVPYKMCSNYVFGVKTGVFFACAYENL